MDTISKTLLKTLNDSENGLQKLMQHFYPRQSSIFPKEANLDELVKAMKENKIVIVGEMHSSEYHENEKKILSYLNNGHKIYIGDEIIEDAQDLSSVIENKEYFCLWKENNENCNAEAANSIAALATESDASVFAVVGNAHILSEKSIQYYLLKKSIVPLVIEQKIEEKPLKIIKYSDYFYVVKGKLY